VAFALRTVLKGRTRGDGQSKSFIKFSNKVCRPSVIERSETDGNVKSVEPDRKNYSWVTWGGRYLEETRGLASLDVSLGKRADNQEIDDLVDEWQPTPLVDDPTEFDEGTLDSVPMIQGPNGLKVKIQPNGKTVRSLNCKNRVQALISS
jgi:hypothetical protein